MAQPPFLNLNPEDIPEKEAEWMAPIIDSINQFAKQVQYCLNRQLTFKENLKAYWKTVQIDAFPFKFASEGEWKPDGIIIAAAQDITNAAKPEPFAAAGLAYSFDGKSVVINAIGGTVAKHKYSVTFLVIGQ